MKISTLFYTIKQGFANIFRNKWYSLASIATISACLFLFGLFYCIVANFQNILKTAEEGVSVTVFFHSDMDNCESHVDGQIPSEQRLEEIGQEIANYFGIKYYDKELLEHAANDSGICKELFEHHDEKPTNSFLYSLVMDTYSFGYSSAGFSDMPMNHKIFLAQFDAIKKLAGEGPCVMVGRCADYALADWKDCFSVFVHADFDWRINRIAAKYNKTPKEARDIITKTDKSRASYYNYYTNKKWGSAKSYNLCIDSSKYGIDNTVKAIIESIKIFDSTKASR